MDTIISVLLNYFQFASYTLLTVFIIYLIVQKEKQLRLSNQTRQAIKNIHHMNTEVIFRLQVGTLIFWAAIAAFGVLYYLFFKI